MLRYVALAIFVSNVAISESACINRAGFIIDGVSGTYIAGGEGAHGGDEIALANNDAEFNLMNTCEEDWQPDQFKLLPLFGRTFSFVVDLSKVGCASNVVVSLVRRLPNDTLASENNGPVIDIMEANNLEFSSKVYKCDPNDANTSVDTCRRSGCGEDTVAMGLNAYGPGTKWNNYGPGDWFDIDTTKPFEVVASFSGDNTSFNGLVTTLRQRNGEKHKELVLDVSTCSWDDKTIDLIRSGMGLRITNRIEETKIHSKGKPVCLPVISDGADAAIFGNVRIEPPIDALVAPQYAQIVGMAAKITDAVVDRRYPRLAIAGMVAGILLVVSILVAARGLVADRCLCPGADQTENSVRAMLKPTSGLTRVGSSKVSLLILAEAGGELPMAPSDPKEETPSTTTDDSLSVRS